MQSTEPLIAAQKAQAETAFALAAQALAGLEKATALNLQAAKSALAEAAGHAQALLSVQDAQQALALQAGLLQPLAEKATAYGRQVFDIAADTGSEMGRIVEARLAELQQGVLAAVDSALQNAPAGSENALALVKSGFAAAGSAYDGVQKAARQAAEAVRQGSGTVADAAADGAQQQAA